MEGDPAAVAGRGGRDPDLRVSLAGLVAGWAGVVHSTGQGHHIHVRESGHSQRRLQRRAGLGGTGADVRAAPARTGGRRKGLTETFGTHITADDSALDRRARQLPAADGHRHCDVA